MAGEDRTEQPTQRRKEEARRRGQVVRSQEVNSALILLSAFIFLKSCGSWLGLHALGFTGRVLELMGGGWTADTPRQLLFLSGVALAEIGLPLMAVAAAAGCAANLLQVGLLYTPSAIAPKWERINPLQGWQRLFSRRALVEMLKAVLKIAISAYLAFTVLRSSFNLFLNLQGMELAEAVGALARLAGDIVLRIGAFLLVLAAADYLFQYFEHQKAIRMTKQELKEELKQYEGDPQIRGRIRQRQRQLAMRRMMQQVPKADVVITNPTHYAVALKYDRRQDPAPVMVAKGVDEVALRIRRLAVEHDVVIYEDPPLARTIYQTVEIGQAIPENLYEAVANVLAFVYRLRPAHYKKMVTR